MADKVSPRQKLFNTAASLFYRHGYRAVGVDVLAAESGIGKMTLYRHYPSKDDLIVAYLQDSNEVFWENFEQITRDAPTPRGQLLAFFESLQKYVSSPACHGCPFINAAAEYPERDHPGHQVALEHKQSVRAKFRELAQQAGAQQPEVLADQLFLLMDGAYVASRMFGTRNPASHLAGAAKVLIDAQVAG